MDQNTWHLQPKRYQRQDLALKITPTCVAHITSSIHTRHNQPLATLFITWDTLSHNDTRHQQQLKFNCNHFRPTAFKTWRTIVKNATNVLVAYTDYDNTKGHPMGWEWPTNAQYAKVSATEETLIKPILHECMEVYLRMGK